jgi:protein transport protein SEC24
MGKLAAGMGALSMGQPAAAAGPAAQQQPRPQMALSQMPLPQPLQPPTVLPPPTGMPGALQPPTPGLASGSSSGLHSRSNSNVPLPIGLAPQQQQQLAPLAHPLAHAHNMPPTQPPQQQQQQSGGGLGSIGGMAAHIRQQQQLQQQQHQPPQQQQQQQQQVPGAAPPVNATLAASQGPALVGQQRLAMPFGAGAAAASTAAPAAGLMAGVRPGVSAPPLGLPAAAGGPPRTTQPMQQQQTGMPPPMQQGMPPQMQQGMPPQQMQQQQQQQQQGQSPFLSTAPKPTAGGPPIPGQMMQPQTMQPPMMMQRPGQQQFPGQQQPQFPGQQQQQQPQQQQYPGQQQMPQPLPLAQSAAQQQHHMQTPASRAPQPSGSSQRIDPSAIPRPKLTVPSNPTRYPSSGEGFNVPPAAWSDFVSDDQENCNPRYARATLSAVPITKDLLKESKIPFGVALTPLAVPLTHAGENRVAVVDFGDHGPIRCSRCGAYINPFARWVDGGRAWSCNLCSMSNEVPMEYQRPVDSAGRRRDRNERAELCLSSVEFTAPPSYLLRAPSAHSIVFLVDVSYQAVSSGALNVSLRSIHGCIDALAAMGDGNVRAGIAAFDTSLYFFDISPGRSDPMVAIAGDIEDAFCPLAPDQFRPPVSQSKGQLLKVLDKIRILFPPSNARAMQACAGAAVKAAVDSMLDCGGRIVLFQSQMPQIGEGKLSNREKVSIYGSEKEKELYRPVHTVQGTQPGIAAGQYYETLAKTAAANGIAVDFHVLSQSFVDMATMGQLATLTGGDIRLYPHFVPLPLTATPGGPIAPPPGSSSMSPLAQQQGRVADVNPEIASKVCADVLELISRETATDAVLKVRTSPGVSVQKYFGNFVERPLDGQVDLAVLDSEKAVLVGLQLDGSELRDSEPIFIQAALLYTTAAGARRIRVHNLRLTGTESIQSIFRHADIDSILSFMIRKSVHTALAKDVKFVHMDLIESAIEMLFSYRKNCAANSSPGQLILPESLKLSPLYLSALTKIGAFLVNRAMPKQVAGRSPFAEVSVRCDARSAELHLLNAMPVSRVVPFIYARLYSLHTMGAQQGVPPPADPNDQSFKEAGRPAAPPASYTQDQLLSVVLPKGTYPSSEQLEVHGLHLLEHAQGLYLFVGNEVDEDVLHEAFGPQYQRAVDLPQNLQLPQLQTDFSMRIWTVIAALRARKQWPMAVHVVVPSDVFGKEHFAALLVEDKVGASRSYVDLLCHMHSAIQQRLTQ